MSHLDRIEIKTKKNSNNNNNNYVDGRWCGSSGVGVKSDAAPPS